MDTNNTKNLHKEEELNSFENDDFLKDLHLIENKMSKSDQLVNQR